MRNTQSGMSTFAALIVIAIAAAAAYFAYYAYQGSIGGGEAPSCKSAFGSCMQSCRRNSTDAPTAQACQTTCTREQATCERAVN